jgi:hypothetical protein
MVSSHAVVDGSVAVEARVPVSREATRESGLSRRDQAMLFLIGLVVVLVSLPRLRRFALRENETDAARMLRVLWSEAEAQGVRLHPGVLGALFGPGTGLQNRSEDVELLDDGRLRRHGYLFDVVEDVRGRAFIGAWPWEHGRTGLGAFSIDAERGLIGCENKDGFFSGEDRPPTCADLADAHGWRGLPQL